MIAVAERDQTTIVTWNDLVQFDVACSVCGRHIAKSRHASDLPVEFVWARAWCLRCHKWRWYDVVTGKAPAHHHDG